MILTATLMFAAVGVVIVGIRFLLSAMKSLGSAPVEIDERDYLGWQEQELERLRMDYAVAEELGGMDPQTLENLRVQIVAMEENIAKTRVQVEAQPQPESVAEPTFVPEPRLVRLPVYAFLDKRNDLDANL